MRSLTLAAFLCATAAGGGPAMAQAAAAPAAKGDVIVDARLRYEFVDQEGLPENADALTLRARLGYETAKFGDWRGLIELEGVAALNADYNSSVNGRTRHPLVPDPEGVEVNRAQLSYDGLPATQLVLGRQRIVLNNARFIGNVGFRQNEQTFDAVKVVNTGLEPLTLTYAYVGQVQRVFGNESPQGQFTGDSHIVQADAKTPLGQLSGYSYLLDLEEAPRLSSVSTGLRLTGQRALAGPWTLTYAAEYARQTEHGRNPVDYALDYQLVEAGLKRGSLSGTAGLETLGGDGRAAFQTPLATLHAFQGWADVFLTTPNAGVRDAYLLAAVESKRVPGFQTARATIRGHRFTDDDGSVGYGRELDVAIGGQLNPTLGVELKAAFFDGERAPFADRTKLWAAVEVKY